MANAHKEITRVGSRGGCPFFWSPRCTLAGPAYLVNYRECFDCRFGRHASLFTTWELEVCLGGRRGDCPARRRP